MTFSNGVQLASAVIAAIGFLAVVYQIRSGDMQRRRENLRMCRQATLEFARQTLDTRHRDWPELPDEFSKEEVLGFIDRCQSGGGAHDLESAYGYLGLFETLCIGVQLGIYDAHTVDELYGDRLVRVFENYKPLIDRRRRDTGDEDFYISLEQAARDFKATELKGEKQR